jgi:hypothetical protein
MDTIYRVTRARGSNQGYLEEHGRDVLYVGYDHAVALHAYVESEAKDHHGQPGDSYTQTRWERASVEDGCHPNDLDWAIASEEN